MYCDNGMSPQTGERSLFFLSKRRRTLDSTLRTIVAPLAKSVITSLRFYFAFFGLSECYGDVTSGIGTLIQPAVTLAYTDSYEAANTNRPTATLDRRISNRLSGRRDGTGQCGSSPSC
jgi:hypothetical protein